MKEGKMEADVLCVGGGIAGLMAAIRASELGARVIVIEKANTMHSGAGGAGNDHFGCYIPEVHGPNIQPLIRSRQNYRGMGMVEASLVRAWLENSFDMVKLWDSWGIPMKYNGRYEFAGQGHPGGITMGLHYQGRRQKPILTGEALKRGVEIINRVMVFELLGGPDGVTGALGIDTRDDRLIEFQAKSVVLGTGRPARLYPGPVHGQTWYTAIPPSVTGDGRAMAYRVGAKLANMEMEGQHCGVKYFAKQGQATWIGVVRDAQGKPIGPFVTQPDETCKRYGDAVLGRYPTLFEDYAKSGRGPVYMDCRGISDENYEYMMLWLKNEGNVALINYLEEEGIDLRKNAVEFMRYEMRLMGGVHHNEKAETSVKGLYAAGDELRGGIGNAATIGWIAGDNAAKYAKEAGPPKLENVKPKIEETTSLINDIKSREVGPDWKEVNIALQQIMKDYAGSVRSETILEAGLNHLRRVKQKAYSTMMAKNQWELIRCLEVLNLLDLGEIVFIAANERKETRGAHVRPDYPVTNPQLDRSVLLVKKADGKTVTEWKEIKD